MKMEWLGWCIAFLIAGAGCFIVSGYFAPRGAATEKKEQKKLAFSWTPSILLLLVGFIFSGLSLWWVYKNSVGKAGTPRYLDKSTFHRALAVGENLSGKKFVNVQNAANEISTVTSDIQPSRGAFLRVVKLPTGWDFEVIEPNSP